MSHRSICSDISRAPSTSIPRYLTRTEEAVTRAFEVLVDERFDSKTLRAVADHILDRSHRFLEVISPRAET